ncbi:transmembrane [Olea europaea subsp. europaea]|uniref:Transmembrane n=1 Tax=Olea europaea subsp. europaea TaxID=158383 RepID=A0A8S0QK42_OLEEU|nr:transmembrane [Olea europaea subsp. europaea]
MASSEGFPAADSEKELNPGQNMDAQVDPISSEIAASKEQSEAEAAKKHKQEERKDCLQTFKTAIIVSGIIVAAAGALFAITKKLKQK